MAGSLHDHPSAKISPHLVELTQDVLFGAKTAHTGIYHQSLEFVFTIEVR